MIERDDKKIRIVISKRDGFTWLLLISLAMFVATSLIIAFTPLRNYLPGYLNHRARRQIVENTLAADSLQELISKQSLYIMNVQDILRGKVKVDTVASIDSLTTLRSDSLLERTRREEEFRRKYEDEERYNLTAVTPGIDLGNLIFYRPSGGQITRRYNPAGGHFGIDLSSSPDESVASTLGGTIIMSAYTAADGYVVVVQHEHDFLSVYKHLGATLRKPGEEISAGEVIGLVGSGETEGEEPHLHFELWNKGQPVDPAKTIAF